MLDLCNQIHGGPLPWLSMCTWYFSSLQIPKAFSDTGGRISSFVMGYPSYRRYGYSLSAEVMGRLYTAMRQYVTVQHRTPYDRL